MSILQRLKQLFVKATSGYTFFDVPVAEQQRFLAAMAEPVDDIERSYLQYCCQNRMLRHGMALLLNCAALPMSAVYSIRLRRSSRLEAPLQSGGAVLLFSGSPQIVPNSLREEFDIVQLSDFQDSLCMAEEDRFYLRELRRRYPFSFYFRFKCMLKIAMYRRVFLQYAPDAVICSSEYSFTSSLLTDYCRKNGIEHINIMHGEKAFNLRDTFFRFDRCYVWDAHYVSLFMDLRAESSQFRIEVPPSLRFPKKETAFPCVDYTYYLAAEPREQVEAILQSLSILANRGSSVAVRPHPQHLDCLRFLQENSFGISVELPSEVPIEDSILRTGHVMAMYSTVLLQGIFNGVPIVVDDISNRERYEKFRQLRFIFMEKEHGLLSELTRAIQPQGTLYTSKDI